MKNYFLWPAVTVLLCAKVGAQQEQDSTRTLQLNEVVVSDTRFELKRENSGKTVITISQKELEQNQGRSVVEIINTKSGIEINGTRSYAGQNLSTYVRGGNNRQVLVVIDGIQVSDPSSTSAEYDLRLLNAAQIESIEILKGAASTLYGNSAATAVINIITKKANKEGLALDVISSFGTNQTEADQNYNISDISNTVNLTAKDGNISVLASGGHQFTDGLSAAIGTESDLYSRIDGNFKVGYQFTDRFNVKASAFYNKLNSDYDNGFPIEDADFNFTSEQSRFGLSSVYTYENGSIAINTAFNQITRAFESSFPATYDSQSYILDVFNKYTFTNKIHTIIGVNYIDSKTLFFEQYNSNTVDPYLNAVYVGEQGININAGVRLNNHSEYGSNFIYNINPSYRISINDGYLKFMGSYATSYIAPNLSQLYGPFGANSDLEPEEDTTLEGGLEFKVSDALTFNAIYFNRKEDDRIEYVTIDPNTFESQYRNSAETAYFNGVEVGLNSEIAKELIFSANYTYTNSKEGLALRVPKNKINATLGYDIKEKTFVGLSYQYVSDRTDTDFATFSDVTLDNFSLFNLQLKHNFYNNLSGFLSVDNILNEKYTELVSYTTKGRNVRLGFRLNL
ncbi:TonB-dependent receptor plug domain-containing protein [Maribacter hydrothermalis]|uniref:TonB-dependent receptor n=1 Tax=Maribacter hydrothermalis TaxID=1836467 RepID=A0A1B7Z7U1_9FLAO|nr:TonB-dependent receptor [Maribacter hydrothermalis]APQ15875.1 TonB-dependent receptor [Maribacter hydrothermalis]OBR38746.1 TonB-dependent receptor [Maribacter hydrothermalis]